MSGGAQEERNSIVLGVNQVGVSSKNMIKVVVIIHLDLFRSDPLNAGQKHYKIINVFYACINHGTVKGVICMLKHSVLALHSLLR